MAFCENCGRELAEGEVCTCTQPVIIPPVEEINTNEEITTPAENVAEEAVETPAPEQVVPNFNQNPYAQNVPPQNGYYIPTPPVYYPPVEEKKVARTDYPQGYKIKKKYVAVILGWALGTLGIHNFYLGNKNKALAQLLISTVGSIFTLGLSAVAVAVWSIVETVLILTENIDADAEGYKIQTIDEAFKANNNE